MAIGENKTLEELVAQANAEYSKQRFQDEMLQRGLAMQAAQAQKQQNLYANQLQGVQVLGAGGGTVGGVMSSTSTQPFPKEQKKKEWWEAKDGIKTERLFLMQLEPTSDFIDTILEPDIIDEVCRWLNDQELMRFSVNRHFRHTAEGQAEYWVSTFGRRNLMKGLPSKYWFIFQIDKERRSDDVLIGTITGIVNDNKAVDIGILLGREQGNGYAAEAMSGVINHYNARGVTRFTCGTDERHEAMIKLAQTMGMEESFRDSGNIYFGMTIPSAAPKATRTAKNFATMNTQEQLEYLAHQKADNADGKASLVRKMKEAFYDSSTWTGR